MQPDQFDTRAFFMADSATLAPASPRFANDLERFARRAESAEKSQGGIMALEALVIFGLAGRGIDEARWNGFAGEVAARVRQGKDEEAARLLVPHDAAVAMETLGPSAECARFTLDGVAVDVEAIGHSRCAAIVAAVFRALSAHFGGEVVDEESTSAAEAAVEDELAESEAGSGGL